MTCQLSIFDILEPPPPPINWYFSRAKRPNGNIVGLVKCQRSRGGAREISYQEGEAGDSSGRGYGAWYVPAFEVPDWNGVDI